MFRLPWPTRKDASTPVALALQGGGAHGAYTWGVLDRLLEAGVPIEGISGTSAGAMNAVALAEGWTTGGAEGARAALDRFWTAVGDSVPFHLELLQSLSPSGDGSLPSPMNMMLGLARVFSPYQLNPFELNPLRDVVRAQFDFERIRRACPLKLFIAATAVRTGKVRLFRTAELGEAALLASACLPTLHHAVEIDGEHYWDGGFTANPAIYPLLYECDTPDLLMVLLNPLQHEQAPRSAEDIAARSMELGFSTTFLREMRMIAHARQFIAERPRWSPIGRLERKLLRERF
ncbi:patatin-like phospholipase family protein, partial [Thauera aminoaromatica]